jgi:hypothetical protein
MYLQDNTKGPRDAVNCEPVTTQPLEMRPLHYDMMIPLLFI